MLETLIAAVMLASLILYALMGVPIRRWHVGFTCLWPKGKASAARYRLKAMAPIWRQIMSG